MAEKFILSSGIDIKFFKKYIRLVEGDVKYTTKSRPKGKIALLFTEMDLYQSTKDALENLFGKMSKGGIVCPLYSESNKISFPGNIKAIKDFFGSSNDGYFNLLKYELRFHGVGFHYFSQIYFSQLFHNNFLKNI